MPFVAQNGDGVQLPRDNQVVVSTSITLLVAGKTLGFVQSVNRTDTRRVDRVRHLDADDAGRIVEQAPGPEDYTLRINGFAVYPGSAALTQSSPGARPTGTLLNQILSLGEGRGAAAFRCLSSQSLPFSLIEQRRHPGARERIGRTWYADCWMTNFSSPMQIGQITIAEEVQAQPTYVDNR